jgi:hypothetical protein
MTWEFNWPVLALLWAAVFGVSACVGFWLRERRRTRWRSELADADASLRRRRERDAGTWAALRAKAGWGMVLDAAERPRLLCQHGFRLDRKHCPQCDQWRLLWRQRRYLSWRSLLWTVWRNLRGHAQ